ncbi:MAG: capsule assembly Wzi family protein [Bacteroidaceae bacterium]|nr:capsule assembly Wzi family protein [Bacteroidaceae bacterium]
MNKHWYLPLLILPLTANAQISRFGEDVSYRAELVGTTGSGSHAPFWFTNNRYGLGAPENGYGYLRASVLRATEADATRNWRLGYGADVAVAAGMQSHAILQQLYADIEWQALRLSIGQKERPMELKSQTLSSGAMTSGINARPLPQVRLELPEFWLIPGTRDWLAVKAHIAYGCYTDNGWQRDFTTGTQHPYTANSLYHSKAGFLRVGNKDKFPLTLTGGLEMSCQFGGEAWNLKDRPDHSGPFDPHQKLNSGLKSFWHALVPGGNDVNDGDYNNSEGNQLGSWHLRLDYEGAGWSVGAYAEHFFDDHSQMFMQYPWRDMLYGIEGRLPKNPVLSAIVYEHLRTTHQSGPIYHDATATMPEDIFGIDNYYNHQIYGGWQHAGFSMGHALLLSPLYNTSKKIVFLDTRVLAHHIGIQGEPTRELGYRVLYTHAKSLGFYDMPRTEPAKGDFLLAEVTYRPHQVEGLGVSAAFGQNWGTLLGKASGAMLTLSYSGWIGKK